MCFKKLSENLRSHLAQAACRSGVAFFFCAARVLPATMQKLAALPWKAPVFVGAVLLQAPVVKAMPDGGHVGGDQFQFGTFEYVLLVWSCLCFIAGFVLRTRLPPAPPGPPPRTITHEVGMNTDAVVPETLMPSSSSTASSSSSAYLNSESVHFSSKSDVAHFYRECGHLKNCERVLSHKACKDCLRASARLSRR